MKRLLGLLMMLGLVVGVVQIMSFLQLSRIYETEENAIQAKEG